VSVPPETCTRKCLIGALLPTCDFRRIDVGAGGKPATRGMAGRLVLMVVGALLMIAPPFAFALLNLTSRFDNVVIAGIELPALAVGLAMLYLAFSEPKSAS